MFPNPQTAPLEPTWDDGSKNVVAPANTQKFKWLFFVADMIIPIFVTSPPDSFMPTILGCFAHSIATSGGKSTLKYWFDYVSRPVHRCKYSHHLFLNDKDADSANQRPELESISQSIRIEMIFDHLAIYSRPPCAWVWTSDRISQTLGCIKFWSNYNLMILRLMVKVIFTSRHNVMRQKIKDLSKTFYLSPWEF